MSRGRNSGVDRCIVAASGGSSLPRGCLGSRKMNYVCLDCSVSKGGCARKGFLPRRRFCRTVEGNSVPAATRMGPRGTGTLLRPCLGRKGSVLRVTFSSTLDNACGDDHVTTRRLVRSCPSHGVVIMSSLNTSLNRKLLICLTRRGGRRKRSLRAITG